MQTAALNRMPNAIIKTNPKCRWCRRRTGRVLASATVVNGDVVDLVDVDDVVNDVDDGNSCERLLGFLEARANAAGAIFNQMLIAPVIDLI